MPNQLHSTATEVAALVPELWSAKAVPTLMEKMVLADSVARDYEGEINALGNKVNIHTFPQFDVAVDLAETGTSDAESVTATEYELVINHQLVKDYIITYMAEVQAMEFAQKLGDLAIFSIMKKMQQLLFTDTVASSSSPDHQIAYASGSTLALADILGAKELLDTQNVEDQGRKMVLGAAQLNDLFNITGFVSRDYIAGANAMASGGVSSSLLGFDVKWTTEASAVSYFFHPIYMQLAIQRAPKVEVHSLGADGQRGTRFNFTMLFGNKQVDNKRVVEIA